MKRLFVAVLCGILIVSPCNVIASADTSTTSPKPTYEGYLGNNEIEGLQDAKAVKEPQYSSENVPHCYNSLLPATYRTANLPEIRNQNPYGTCWAFSTIALGELSIQKQEQKRMDLSEAHLTYFTYNTPTDPLGGTAGDHNRVGESGKNYLSIGGNIQYSTRILAEWDGLTSEEDFPYSNVTSSLATEDASSKDVAHLRNAYRVNLVDNPEIAKEMILDYGGLGVSYYATLPTDTLHSSYYNESNNAYYCDTDRKTNHAVAIVGWDDTFKKENFTIQPKEDGAWIIRNSWGEDDDCYSGYFYLSYYDKSLTETAYAYDVVSKDSEDYYKHNYQYDGCVADGLIGYNDSVTCANIFTSKFAYEELKAISFTTYNVQEEYQIAVYRNLSDLSDPESGTLVAEESGNTECEGYYTIPLTDYVTLQQGDTYSVVVTLKKPGSVVSFTTEYSQDGWMKCTANADAGQSFYKEGDTWYDIGKQEDINVRIKAFTNDIEDRIPVAGITVKGSFTEMNVGEIQPLTVQFTPSNASNQEVRWSSLDDAIASVDDQGKVTAKKPGVVSILATSKDGGYTDSYQITVNPAITGIALNLTRVDLAVGEKSEPLRVSYTPVGIDGDKYLIYQNRHPEIATIEDGRIVAKAPGYTEITAVYKAVKATCEVYVAPDAPDVEAVWNQETKEVTISWKKVAGITGYYILRCDESGSKYVAECPADATSYVDTSVDGQYIYGVQPYVNNDGVSVLSYADAVVDYRIAYELNGGSSNKNPTTYNYKTSPITLKNPTRTGYTFNGWYTDRAYTVKKTQITVADWGNLTLYAKWTAEKYPINYQLNGGSNNANNPDSYDIMTPTITLASPTRSGYTFDGWYTTRDYLTTTKVTTIEQGSMERLTLYAKWVPIKYTLTYQLNGGKNSTKNPVSYYITTSTINLASPTRTGYTFSGWYTTSTFSSKSKVSSIAAGSMGNKMLFAKWVAKKYSITYKLNGGKNSTKNPSSYYITTSTINLASPTRAGYTFNGWYTSSSYKSSTKVTRITKGSAANKTLYAKWTANTYNIRFDKNKATSGSMKTLTKRKYGTTYKLSANTYKRKGYVFTGWNTKKNGTGKTYKNKASIKNMTTVKGKTVTLYAQWKKK